MDKEGHELLEELLMDEDDPLYWLATEDAAPPHSDDIPDTIEKCFVVRGRWGWEEQGGIGGARSVLR